MARKGFIGGATLEVPSGMGAVSGTSWVVGWAVFVERSGSSLLLSDGGGGGLVGLQSGLVALALALPVQELGRF